MRIDGLIERLVDVARMLSAAAYRAGLVAAAAAVIVIVVIRLEPPLGFGWAFPGWWLLGMLLLAPAVLLAFWAWRVGKVVGASEAWPREAVGAAGSGIDATSEALTGVRDMMTKRRGAGRLLRGLWGIRGVAGRVRSLAGDAVPAAGAFTPFSLLATAAAVVGGVALLGLAGLLVLVRLLS